MGETVEVLGPVSTLGENACQRLSPEQIAKYWPEMVLELRKISHVWDTWWTEDSLRLQMLTENMQVWAAGKPPVFHLVVVTQVLHYPANSILQAVLAFGTKVDEVLPLVVGTLEHYAQVHGCRYAEVFGRFGWQRKLEKFGYSKSATMMTKPLGILRRH